LMRDEVKNRFSPVGHNPQMGSILPVYLPGNGSLLAAVAVLAAASDATSARWVMRAEGFPELPQ